MKGGIRLLVCTNRRIVTKAIEVFKKSYPQVSFRIDHRQEDTGKEYDVIISDDLTLCRDYTCTPIISEKILLAVAKSNPLSSMEIATAGELEAARFITMNEDSSLAKTSLDICHTLGFEPNITIRTNDRTTCANTLKWTLALRSCRHFLGKISLMITWYSNLLVISPVKPMHLLKRRDILQNR